MSAQDLWDKLDALPWPGPWVAHTFEIDCPCPNGEHCGDTHDCAEVEDRTAYPASPEKPAEPGHGQCVVQINTPGLETFAKPCAEFIAAARNELPAIRARLAEMDATLAFYLRVLEEEAAAAPTGGIRVHDGIMRALDLAEAPRAPTRASMRWPRSPTSIFRATIRRAWS